MFKEQSYDPGAILLKLQNLPIVPFRSKVDP